MHCCVRVWHEVAESCRTSTGSAGGRPPGSAWASERSDSTARARMDGGGSPSSKKVAEPAPEEMTVVEAHDEVVEGAQGEGTGEEVVELDPELLTAELSRHCETLFESLQVLRPTVARGDYLVEGEWDVQARRT